LAYLESHPLRLAERDAAQTALEEAKERLDAETAYGEAIVEQSLQGVRGLEISVDHEMKEVERVVNLTSARAVPSQRLIDQRFLLETRQNELRKANAALTAAKASLTRTRILVGIKSAEAQAKIAEAQLELSIIRAPIAGEILRIFTHAGERVGDEPILSMGDTANMYVVAEVHETDVSYVRVGQRATITSPALSGPVEGRVEEISPLIYKNDVLDIDPRAAKDTRVVEVRVKLANPELVSRFTHLEVSTRIDLDSPAPAASR
jgi:HlyD family secretion protein